MLLSLLSTRPSQQASRAAARAADAQADWNGEWQRAVDAHTAARAAAASIGESGADRLPSVRAQLAAWRCDELWNQFVHVAHDVARNLSSAAAGAFTTAGDRVRVQAAPANAAAAREWMHLSQLLDVCIECGLAVPLLALVDYGGRRVLAAATVELDPTAPVPLPADDPAVRAAEDTLHRLVRAERIFRLSLVRALDGRTYVLGCDAAPRVGDLPLRVEALRSLGPELHACAALDVAAFVRACMRRAAPALEKERWRVSAADNVEPLVRLLRASGLNQRYFGLCRRFLPRDHNVEAALLLHCVTVVLKRALFERWAALPRAADTDQAQFERSACDAAAAVLNEFLLPWRAPIVAEDSDSDSDSDGDGGGSGGGGGGGAADERHDQLLAALVAHFGEELLVVIAPGSGLDSLVVPSSDSESESDDDDDSSGSSSDSSRSSSSSGKRFIDPLQGITPVQVFNLLEQEAGLLYNRTHLHRVQCNLPFLSEHVTVRCLTKTHGAATPPVSPAAMYALCAGADSANNDELDRVDAEIAEAERALAREPVFADAPQPWRVQRLRGLLYLARARIFSTSETEHRELLHKAATELTAAAAAAPPGEPQVAFALASTQFDVAFMSRQQSDMLRAIDRQQRAAAQCAELKPFVADKHVAVEDPSLIDYYQQKLTRKALLPMDLGTLNALMSHNIPSNAPDSPDQEEDEDFDEDGDEPLEAAKGSSVAAAPAAVAIASEAH